MNWESVIIEVMKNVVVPELASFMKNRFEQTGTWPTESELKTMVNNLAEDIKREGQAFLQRNENFISELPKNPAGNSNE